MMKPLLSLFFIFLALAFLLPEKVHAIIIGAPFIAVSAVKVALFLVSVLSVPVTVFVKLIKQDTKKSLIISALVLLAVSVGTYIALRVFGGTNVLGLHTGENWGVQATPFLLFSSARNIIVLTAVIFAIALLPSWLILLFYKRKRNLGWSKLRFSGIVLSFALIIAISLVFAYWFLLLITFN